MRSRMTVIPKLMSQWWETLERPHRILDQQFGLGMNPENFFKSSMFGRRFPYPYFQPMEELMREEGLMDNDKGYSVVKADKDKFHVALDVQQFKPDEIHVKVVDNRIVVEGKHEEKRDDHGYIARHFTRTYLIPEQCDPDKTTSSLSSDGVLTITTPRKPEAIENKKEIPIKVETSAKIENGKKEEPQEKKRMAAAN